MTDVFPQKAGLCMQDRRVDTPLAFRRPAVKRFRTIVKYKVGAVRMEEF